MGDSDYEETCVLNTIVADGVACAFVENSTLRITYYEVQRIGSLPPRKVIVARVSIPLGGVLESRAVITDALKRSMACGRRENAKDLGDLLMN